MQHAEYRSGGGMKCERCQTKEAETQRCPGDGATHRHGMVHARAGGWIAVCNDCIKVVADEWGGYPGSPERQMRRAVS